jgi:hypothetical protein
MPVIKESSGLCTVIVTVDCEPEVMPDLEDHARSGLALFREFDGFVSGALHKSADGKRLVQYLQWETESDHVACVNHPRWDDFPSTRRFMAIVDSGQAEVDVRVFNVLAATQ